jgi:hypothetical protein
VGNLGPCIEYDPTTCMYTINRPATPERAAVKYSVTEQEVISLIDGGSRKFDDVSEMLFDERVDALLRPIQRRAAIAHTRKLNGS